MYIYQEIWGTLWKNKEIWKLRICYITCTRVGVCTGLLRHLSGVSVVVRRAAGPLEGRSVMASWRYTGCSLNILFFSKYFIIFRNLVFLCFPSVSVCVHSRQVEHQRCSRTGRVQKNHKFLRKKHNIYWTPCITYDDFLWVTYVYKAASFLSRIVFFSFS